MFYDVFELESLFNSANTFEDVLFDVFVKFVLRA